MAHARTSLVVANPADRIADFGHEGDFLDRLVATRPGVQIGDLAVLPLGGFRISSLPRAEPFTSLTSMRLPPVGAGWAVWTPSEALALNT